MTKDEQLQVRREWEDRIVSFKASGQSAKTWCALNNVKLHQLRYRLGRVKTSKTDSLTPPMWVRAEAAEISPGAGLLVKVGKAVVEVKTGFDPKLLLDVVLALTATC